MHKKVLSKYFHFQRCENYIYRSAKLATCKRNDGLSVTWGVLGYAPLTVYLTVLGCPIVF